MQSAHIPTSYAMRGTRYDIQHGKLISLRFSDPIEDDSGEETHRRFNFRYPRRKYRGSTSRTERAVLSDFACKPEQMRSTRSTERSAGNGERQGDVHSSEPTRNEKIRLESERILSGMNKWAKERGKEMRPPPLFFYSKTEHWLT